MLAFPEKTLAYASASLFQLPPGPRGLPLIGNLLSLREPDKIPEITTEWMRQYGPVVYTKMGGTNFIWLNSPKAVKDLMDKRGSIYSSRPRMPMVKLPAFEAVSNKKRQFFMPYSEEWRALRRVSHAALNLKTSQSYIPVQDFESKQVIWDFLHAKDDWEFYDHNRRYANSVIMLITYGHRVATWTDPWFKKIFSVLDHFTLMAEPGAWLVDGFPSLCNLPSVLVQNWWKVGREWHAQDSAVFLELYRDLVEKIEKGTAPDCFVKDFHEAHPEKNGIDEEGAAYAAGSMVEAGSESTSSVINTWLLACLLWPDVVKKGQEEIDRVVGSGRMPDFSDESSLPYVRAMAKEALRWRPITKLGTPHATTEDDWYEGYFIPKGSVVVLNWWAIHHDDNRWKQPEIYDPSRYLNDPLSTAEAMTTAEPEDRDHFTYGAGRRACPGVHIAQNSLFINMARVLWAFNITKSVDKEGNVIEPSTKTEQGFIGIPERFPCHFEPRSPERARIVDEAWKTAEKEGLQWTRTRRNL
ncbi:cytochrome P450 [Paraphoma chrysanthemicola]|uniref:Cytochrome P450 n=1 Tax=Paraphoma chrysanthemicola TaxID=798071 RepID=A0A8K0R6Y1_9PLEO|nr:cytochrome P450 [Paraphoma chrysanthemicola]